MTILVSYNDIHTHQCTGDCVVVRAVQTLLFETKLLKFCIQTFACCLRAEIVKWALATRLTMLYRQVNAHFTILLSSKLQRSVSYSSSFLVFSQTPLFVICKLALFSLNICIQRFSEIYTVKRRTHACS